ncbi:MAG: hypothetical protein ACODAG_08115 [Myxococcota bacterium]
MGKITGALALAGAIALGACGGDDATNEAVAEEEPTEVTVEVTPQACLEAFDYADQGFGLTADSMEVSSQFAFAAADGFDAVINNDVAGMEAATEEITTLNERLDGLTAELNDLAPLYKAARDECEAAADE